MTVVSSFCAVFAILLSSMAFPASAAISSGIDPADYVGKIDYDFSNNTQTVYYWFDQTPYISLKDNDGSTSGSYGSLNYGELDEDGVYIFRVYPLGTSFTPGRDITGGAIEVSDFKSNAIFDFFCPLRFELGYTFSGHAYGYTNFYCVSYPYICYYDADGRFLSQTIGDSVRTDITLPIQETPELDADWTFVLEEEIPLDIPADAVYMAPCFITYLYAPEYHSCHTVHSIRAICDEFSMIVDKSFVLEQTETMQAIDDKLGDIISGTDEQMDSAQAGSDKADEISSDMVSILDRLAELRDNNFTFPMDAIEDFLTSGGWNDIRYLFEPLLNWSPWITIILLVLSFVAISVLLFGR